VSRYAVLDRLNQGRRVAAIHTSDRGLYKSCRRKWFWQSHLRQGLEAYTRASPLWFGFGIHFALESVHGSQFYPSGADAFSDFVSSSLKVERERMPDDWQDLHEMGRGMMDYYEKEWLVQRETLPTFVHNGVPQIEVQFEIELPIPQDFLELVGYDAIVYRGTMDRVARDPETGLLWIIEYKTAAQFETLHLGIDPQVTAYLWAAKYIYGIPCMGVVYQQFLKAVPETPRLLKSGRLSTDARQNTTHRRYRQGLIDLYGKDYRVNAPGPNIECLNALAEMEGPDADPYIRRDRAHRSDYQIDSEGVKILLEVFEMLNPNTPMYPHATRMCKYCPFEAPCMAMDDGDDFESMLKDETLYTPRASESSQWSILAKRPLKPIPMRAVIPREQLQALLQQGLQPNLPPQESPEQQEPQP